MEINPSYKKVFPCWGPVSKHPMAGVGLREEITFGTFCCASTVVEEVAIAIATAVVIALRGGILRILVLVVIVVVIVRVVYSRV